MYNDDIFSLSPTFDFRIGWNKEVTAKVGIPLMEGIQQAGD